MSTTFLTWCHLLLILPQNPNPSKTVSGDKIYYQDENGCFLEAQVIKSDPIRMEMRLYDGKEYFTRSLGDLLTNVMPEPPAKKRNATRGRNQQPSSTTCETQINQQVDDSGRKPYVCHNSRGCYDFVWWILFRPPV